MKRRRLYYIGKGGSSWRDPRNWSRTPGGAPLGHLHADGKHEVTVGGIGENRVLDLYRMPHASIEISGFHGRLRLPDGQRVTLDRPNVLRRLRARLGLSARVRVRLPKVVRDFGRSGWDWQRAVAAGMATILSIPAGIVVVPKLAGGAPALVAKSTAATNTTAAGSPNSVTPTFGATPTKGSLLVVSVSNTRGNTGGSFTSTASYATITSNATRAAGSALFYRNALGGGSDTAPTLAYSLGGTIVATLWEFSGVANLDQSANASAAGTVSVPPSPTATCGAADLLNTGTLVVSANASTFASAGTDAIGDNFNNGATDTGSNNNNATSTRDHYFHGYGTTTGNGSATNDNITNNVAATTSVASVCIATFRTPTTLFWVSGTGTWDFTTKTHWATSTGGAGSKASPGPGDTVNFDSNSGAAATVTVSNAIATTVTVNKSDITLTHSQANTGSFCIGTFTLTAGTWNWNGQILQIGAFSSANANARTLTPGTGSTMTITGTGTAWDTSTSTNLTVSSNTATVTMNGAGVTFTGGSANYNGLTVSMTGSGTAVVTTTGTLGAFTRTGTASKTDALTITSNFTVTNAITLGGSGNKSASAFRLVVQSATLGTQVVPAPGSVVISGDVNFQDVNFSGSPAWTNTAGGGSWVGDAGGNGTSVTTNATVAAAQTQSIAASFSWDSAAWSGRTGGPLPQDDVTINGAGGTNTITANNPVLGKSITFSCTGTPVFSITAPGAVAAFFGSISFAAGMTTTSTSNNLVPAGRSSFTITTNAVTLNFPVIVAAPGGTYTLQDNWTQAASRAIQLNNGTINDGGKTVVTNAFNSNNSNTRALTISGTWQLAGTGTLTVWNVTSTLALTATGSTVQVTATDSGVTKTFAGASLTYGTLKHTATGSAGLTITGSNTFAALDLECTTARTITLPASGTQTVTGALTLTGSSGQLLSLVSSSPGTATTITQTLCNSYTTAFTSVSADVTIRVEVCTSSALPYETLNALAATGSLPYSANKGIAATASEPYEAEGGVALTAVEPYETLAALAATGPLPYEALAALAKTGDLPYSTLAALAEAAELPYSTLLGLLATNPAPYETLAGLAASVSAPYEAAGDVRATAASPYESLAALAATGGLPYETLVGVALTGALPYETLLGLLTTTGPLPYEALAAVAAAKLLPYEALTAGISSAQSFPYETLAGLATVTGLPYSTVKDVAASASSPYEALAAVAEAAGLPYETLAVAVLISATAELPYETREGRLGYTSGRTVPVADASGRSTPVADASGRSVPAAEASGRSGAVAESSGVAVPTAKTAGQVTP